MESEVDSVKFKRGFTDRDEIDRCGKATRELRKLPLTIRDVSGMKLAPLLAEIRQLAARGIKHISVDYAQLVEGDGKSRSREEEVAKVSRSLKASAKRNKVSIDLLSQLNDDGKIRESRAIGFDADVVLLLHKNKPKGAAEYQRSIYCAKNRGGKRDWSVPVQFRGEFYQFSNAI